MNVLCVSAHPDDEVLGCGGTLARLATEGHDVFIAVLGEGITSRFEARDGSNPRLVQTLDRCGREVSEMLGAKQRIAFKLPDNRFDSVPVLNIIKIVENLVVELTPEVIYTHHGGDLNVDHIAAHRAVLTATRPKPGQPVREVYSYEVPSSTDWAFQRFEPVFRPNTFVDIVAHLETKVEALRHYDSEVRSFPHPRSPEALRATARRWGSVCGCEAAEAFELVRAIRPAAGSR